MTRAGIVHVVDDDDAVRNSLRILLDAAGFEVILHDSAEAFFGAAIGLPLGCVLTDLRMPGLGGLALQQRLRETGLPMPVIVMTGHGDVPTAVEAMKGGALDFLEKPFDDEQLIGAVRRALQAGKAQQAACAAAAEAASRLAALTPREHEVLAGLVAGQTSKAIALDLGASPRTIEVHRLRVMEKLQVRSLPELVRLVQAAGAAPGPAPRGGAQ
ncbi:MAG: response regulator [Alphaproteobacteria bacterium]|nr:response regulator [Alphaproteobacteria bacterium]